MQIIQILAAFIFAYEALDVSIDLNGSFQNFPHFWEKCVGSSHAALSTRADWREHLAQVRKDIGFEFVRYHAVLDDSSLYYSAPPNKGRACYFDVLSTASFLISIGMKPIVELSFTPLPVSPKNATCGHFWYKGCETIPNDYDKYQEIVTNFTATLVDYFGIKEVSTWYFEVYNEADLHWMFTDYYNLYKAAAAGVKSVDKSLQIGGPSSAFGQYAVHLVDYCARDGTPLDFVSTHAYPTTGGAHVAEIRGLLKQINSGSNPVKTSTPFFITEWNSTPNSRAPYHDEVPQAAFIVAAIDQVSNLTRVPDVFSYWAFSDVFTEQGLPADSTAFHGGFGLLSLYGIPKPTYRVMQLLHLEGDQRPPHTTNAISNLTILPLFDSKAKRLSITLAHHACPTCGVIEALDVSISVDLRPDLKFQNAWAYKIANDTSNPKSAWVSMGSPNYLRPSEVSKIMAASELKRESLKMKFDKTTLSLPSVHILPYTVLHITLF